MMQLATAAFFAAAVSAVAAPSPIPPVEVSVPFERLGSFALSHDGARIAFAAADVEDYYHIFTVPAEGGPPVQVTSGASSDRSPRFSPDGSHIAFVSDRSGNADIWVAPASGGPPRQITTDPGDDLEPEWSPDGRQIVFSSNAGGARLLYLAPAAGGQTFPLSAGVGPDRRPSWSSDGEWIAFESRRDGETHAWVMPSAGGEARRASRGADPEYAPQWSQDGRRLRAFGQQGKRLMMIEMPFSAEANQAEGTAPPGMGAATFLPIKADPGLLPPAFSRRGDKLLYLASGGSGIGVMEFKGGAPHTLVEGTGIYRDPSWRPGGRHVVFASDRGGSRDLYVVGTSSGRVARLSETRRREVDPDSSWVNGDIAIVDETPGGSDLLVLEPETGNTLKVTGGSARLRHPDWSADGKQLAYVSGAEGSDDIWVATVGEGSPRRLTSLPDDESYPTWSPDGKWIAFSKKPKGTASDKGSEIWKIALEGGEPVRVGRAAAPEDGLIQPDWSPAGSWIMATLVKEATSDLVLVSPTDPKPPFPFHQRRGSRQHSPAWSPDGARIAFAISLPDQLMLMELKAD